MKTSVVVLGVAILVIGFIGVSSRWADEMVVTGGNDVPAIPPGTRHPVPDGSEARAASPFRWGQDAIEVTGGNDAPAIPPCRR